MKYESAATCVWSSKISKKVAYVIVAYIYPRSSLSSSIESLIEGRVNPFDKFSDYASTARGRFSGNDSGIVLLMNLE